MNPHIEIARITEELRAIYNTNDGPRLIAEMIELEFPDSYSLLSVLRELAELREQIATLEGELEELEIRVCEIG